jgi:hypothetical protein
MKHLTRNQIKRLTEQPEQLSISLYMPLYNTATDERQQNPIRYKNLLKSSRPALEQWGIPSDKSVEFVASISEINWDAANQNEHRGLAVFANSGGVKIFGLPFEVPEMQFVHQRYYVRPLMPYLQNSSIFYVLALSHRTFRLFEATQYSLRELPLEGIPENLDGDRDHDGRSGHTGYRSMTHDNKNVLIHERGGVLDDTRTDTLSMLGDLNASVMRYLENDNAPLILFAPDKLLSEYEKANTYPHLTEPYINADPEHQTDRAIHERALHSATLCLQRTRNTAFEAYNDKKGGGLTSNRIEEILPAADASRIQDLFFKLPVQMWGRFDRTTQRVELQSPDSPQTDDLVDLAAYLTLQRNGRIWSALEEQVPDDEDICAVYRF